MLVSAGGSFTLRESSKQSLYEHVVRWFQVRVLFKMKYAVANLGLLVLYVVCAGSFFRVRLAKSHVRPSWNSRGLQAFQKHFQTPKSQPSVTASRES